MFTSQNTNASFNTNMTDERFIRLKLDHILPLHPKAYLVLSMAQRRYSKAQIEKTPNNFWEYFHSSHGREQYLTLLQKVETCTTKEEIEQARIEFDQTFPDFSLGKDWNEKEY